MTSLNTMLVLDDFSVVYGPTIHTSAISLGGKWLIKEAHHPRFFLNFASPHNELT
jgi:hypothetical protein